MLVEKWAALDEPTTSARIAEARAFVELRLLDRAWVRLKDLVESDNPPIESLLLAGRMFLLRGWPNQARKVVQKGLELQPGNALLQQLWDRAEEANTEPDETSIEGDSASVVDILRVAEEYMAHGAFVRARGLLERIRRREPDHRRAEDLLWAIEGDFSSDVPLDMLCENLGPDLALLSDISDDPEHTESADMDALPLQLDRDDGDGGFPLLFRNLEAQTEALRGAETEVTAIASMIDIGEISLPTDPSEHTDPGHGEDTQIMRVVHKASAPAPVGQGEAKHTSPAEVDKSFNLAEFRREMGVQTPDLSADYAAGPEDEDDSVVIVTRREDDQNGRDQTTDVGGIKLDTETEKQASLRQGASEEAKWAAPPGDDATDRVPGGSKPKKRKETAPSAPPKAASTASASTSSTSSRGNEAGTARPARPKKQRTTPSESQVVTWPWWMAALAVLLACGVVVFAAIALLAAL